MVTNEPPPPSNVISLERIRGITLQMRTSLGVSNVDDTNNPLNAIERAAQDALRNTDRQIASAAESQMQALAQIRKAHTALQGLDISIMSTDPKMMQRVEDTCRQIDSLVKLCMAVVPSEPLPPTELDVQRFSAILRDIRETDGLASLVGAAIDKRFIATLSSGDKKLGTELENARKSIGEYQKQSLPLAEYINASQRKTMFTNMDRAELNRRYQFFKAWKEDILMLQSQFAPTK